MPPLAELQRSFVQSVMTGDVPAALFIGRVPFADALAVHRGTIMAVLVNALRLSYPTVDALVGNDCFDQIATVFAENNPPKTACLAAYGEGFADFLAECPTLSSLGYLPDIARIDRAVDVALRAPRLPRRFALDAAVSLDLPRSLVVLRLDYPADEIRAALGDDAALAAIDTSPKERFAIVWRKGSEAAVQRVSAAAGLFLAALLADAGVDAAFRAAMGGACEADVLHAIQADIFAASFCDVISNPKEI
jgi:Putative DNA-binding domain